MLNKIPEFDHYYVAYLKDDPAKEPIAATYSAPGVLAEAAHKTGRAKADFELREVSREEYERIRQQLGRGGGFGPFSRRTPQLPPPYAPFTRRTLLDSLSGRLER